MASCPCGVFCCELCGGLWSQLAFSQAAELISAGVFSLDSTVVFYCGGHWWLVDIIQDIHGKYLIQKSLNKLLKNSVPTIHLLVIKY